MWQRRGADPKWVLIAMQCASEYWLKLRVRNDDGTSTNIALPRSLIVGSTMDGGLGFNPPGVVAPRLTVPFKEPPRRYIGAVHKVMSGQWDLRNPTVVASALQRRCHSAGLQVDSTLAIRVLEAAVFQSNMPPQLVVLAEQAHQADYAAALHSWLRLSANTKSPTYTEDSQAIVPPYVLRAAVSGLRRCGDTLRGTRRPEELKGWTSNWTLANQAVSAALRTAASAPGLLDTMRDQRGSVLSTTEAVTALSGHNSTAYCRLKSQATRLTSAFLEGKIRHPPSLGLIASKHSALIDFALNEGLRAMSGFLPVMREAAQLMLHVNTCLTHLAFQLEHLLVVDPYWGPQQQY
jgi:hypothetical protein